MILKLTAVKFGWKSGGFFQDEVISIHCVFPIFVEWSSLVILEEVCRDWRIWGSGMKTVVKIGKQKYYVKESPREILAEVRAGKLGAVCPYCDTVSGEKCPNCGAPAEETAQ
jgi:hypothetical protein